MAAVKGHTVNTRATAHLLSQLIQVVWMCVWYVHEQAVKAPSWLFEIQVTN